MIYVPIVTIIGPNMNNLSIKTFINPEQDSELTTYKILGTLKEYLNNIRKFKIYPGLSELIGLVVKLENFRKTISKPESTEGDLYILGEEISLSSKSQPYDNDVENTDDSDYLNWVISQINPILDEGIAIYDFVDQNMELSLINGDPIYKKEGYLIVPDNKISVYNIYKYNSVSFNSKHCPDRTIETEFIQSIPINDINNSRIQCRSLLDYVGDNTLTVYICKTELDFPYNETLFPIAKKKLLNRLSL